MYLVTEEISLSRGTTLACECLQHVDPGDTDIHHMKPEFAALILITCEDVCSMIKVRESRHSLVLLSVIESKISHFSRYLFVLCNLTSTNATLWRAQRTLF